MNTEDLWPLAQEIYDVLLSTFVFTLFLHVNISFKMRTSVSYNTLYRKKTKYDKKRSNIGTQVNEISSNQTVIKLLLVSIPTLTSVSQYIVDYINLNYIL